MVLCGCCVHAVLRLAGAAVLVSWVQWGVMMGSGLCQVWLLCVFEPFPCSQVVSVWECCGLRVTLCCSLSGCQLWVMVRESGLCKSSVKITEQQDRVWRVNGLGTAADCCIFPLKAFTERWRSKNKLEHLQYWAGSKKKKKNFRNAEFQLKLQNDVHK